MKISLKGYGWIQTLIGDSPVEFILPAGSRLIDLLNQLVETRLQAQSGKIWDRATNRFRVPVFVMLEQREVQDFSIILQDGQEISLISPMAGG
jgi:molybdopterin converting factor small subunit